MAAVSMSSREDGEWLLVHQCVTCGRVRANRIAGDDDAVALIRIALRPLSDPRLGRRALLSL